MIHELLTLLTARGLLAFFELLIGGPNQSHKVNFNELNCDPVSILTFTVLRSVVGLTVGRENKLLFISLFKSFF